MAQEAHIEPFQRRSDMAVACCEAQRAQERARAGEDFAKLARELSDDGNREKGGEIGLRPASRLPDLFIDAVRPLITPALLLERLPVSEATLTLVERSRAEIARILAGPAWGFYQSFMPDFLNKRFGLGLTGTGVWTAVFFALAAAGGVGGLLVQLARLRGATVIGTVLGALVGITENVGASAEKAETALSVVTVTAVP